MRGVRVLLDMEKETELLICYFYLYNTNRDSIINRLSTVFLIPGAGAAVLVLRVVICSDLDHSGELTLLGPGDYC